MFNDVTKRGFFITMTTMGLFATLVGSAIAYFDSNIKALVAVGFFDAWIIGVFVINKIADVLYPKDKD